MMFTSAQSGGTRLTLIPSGTQRDVRHDAVPIQRSGSAEFDVSGFEQLRGRWVKLQIRMQVGREEWSAPSLRFELDVTPPEVHIVGLPSPTADSPDIELILNVPINFRSVRLRPNARPGRYTLGTATASIIGRLQATVEMLRSIAAAYGIGRAVTMMLDAGAPARREGRQRIVQQYMQVRLRQDTYGEWIQAFERTPADSEKLASERLSWRCQPTISVVLPVYNIEEKFLRAAMDSVLNQAYPHWQLCIADDCSTEPHVRKLLQEYASRESRIRVAYRSQNGHIVEASNTALQLVTGDWVALLDHDDRLHPLALHFVGEAIAAHPDVALIYSDEDKIDQQGRRHQPYFKCDYNYELLLSYNMICHLTVLRRSLINDLGGFRPGLEGAQDYDLVLRATERLSSHQIMHLPRVLYHWREHPGSTALSSHAKPYAAGAGRRAVIEHLQRRGIQATVTPAPDLPEMNRIRYVLPEPAPKVSIVICTRDRADLLGECVDSIVERSTYDNYEVVIVDNGSIEMETFRLFERLPASRFRVMRDESKFNFSALNNRAINIAGGEFVCLLNNDIEILTADWIEEMLSFAAQPNVGAVGARLWYPGGGLQHAGVILGPLHIVHHAHRHLFRGQLGYFGRAVVHQSFSAVTGAALMIKKSIYQRVGGLDEQLPITFNDIDFCLRVRAAGYRNVWTPYAEMIHYESATRGDDSAPDKRARVEQEASLMKRRWEQTLQNDPAYSPNLSIETEELRIAWPPRIDGYQSVTPINSPSRRAEMALDW